MSVMAAAAWGLVSRRRARSPVRLLRGQGRRVDAVRVDRALRALAFVGPDGEVRADGVSLDLARLHVGRALAELPSGPILASGARLAARASAASAVVGVCALGLVVTRPWSVLEGGDVLLARGGVAPVAMTWLDHVELTARPPEYLHQAEIHEIAMTALALPFGTSISVRGEPQHAGRSLLLSDGITEVPFVEDGAGAVVARWPLEQSGTVRVVARFGAVVVPQSDVLELTSDARRGAGRPARGRAAAGAAGRRGRRHPDQVRGQRRPRSSRGSPGAALRSARGAARARAPRRRDADGRGRTDPQAPRSLPPEESRAGRGHGRGQGQRPAERPEVGRQRGHHDRAARRRRARGAAPRCAAPAP